MLHMHRNATTCRHVATADHDTYLVTCTSVLQLLRVQIFKLMRATRTHRNVKNRTTRGGIRDLVASVRDPIMIIWEAMFPFTVSSVWQLSRGIQLINER